MTAPSQIPNPPDTPPAHKKRLWLALLFILLIILLLWMRSCDQSSFSQQTQAANSESSSSGSSEQSGKKGTQNRQKDEPQAEGDTSIPENPAKDHRRSALDKQAMQDALENLKGAETAMRENIGNLPVGSPGASPLAGYMPATLLGHPRVEVVSSRTQYQGRQGLLGAARASYGAKEAPHISLTIADSGLAAVGRKVYESLAGAESIETATEIRRSGRKNGRSYQLTWNANPKKATATVLIANRVTTEITIDGADSIEMVERATAELPMEDLEALVTSSPSNQNPADGFGVQDIETTLGSGLLGQSSSLATDQEVPEGAPEVLMRALPESLDGLPQVSRHSSSGKPAISQYSAQASAEYARPESSIRYRLELATAVKQLGMLGLNQRTWDRMAALKQTEQQLLIEKQRRILLVQQPARSAAVLKILLTNDAVLTLSAEGFSSAKAAADAAMQAMHQLDLDALDTAATTNRQSEDK